MGFCLLLFSCRTIVTETSSEPISDSCLQSGDQGGGEGGCEGGWGGEEGRVDVKVGGEEREGGGGGRREGGGGEGRRGGEDGRVGEASPIINSPCTCIYIHIIHRIIIHVCCLSGFVSGIHFWLPWLRYSS